MKADILCFTRARTFVFLDLFPFWKALSFLSVAHYSNLETYTWKGWSYIVPWKKSNQQSGREFSLAIRVKLAKNSKNYGSTCSIVVACSKTQGVIQLVFRIQSCNRLSWKCCNPGSGRVHGKNFFKKNSSVPLWFFHDKTYQEILCALCWCHCLRYSDVWPLQTLIECKKILLQAG